VLSSIEAVVAAVVVAAAVLLPSERLPRLRALRRWFAWLAQRRGLAALLVGLLAGASAAGACLISWPEPRVHDEFSYLLGADTLAHGRLANPSHPLWTHFETFHVNQEPTYSSMYPPGQATALALGQVLFGHPLAGVWLSFGLACAAVCWMLQAWLPPRWALVGGLLAAVRFGCLGASGDSPGYWAHSYWGGAVAMLGGALLLGGWRRLYRGPRAIDAAAMAVGAVILANSRPFEGLIVFVAVSIATAVWLLGRKGPPVMSSLWHVCLPAGLVLAVGAGLTALYNLQLTGRPGLLPYQLNGATYSMVPLFLWQPLAPEPVYRHDAMRDYHESWAVPAYERTRSLSGYPQEMVARLRVFFGFYVGPLLIAAFIVLPWTMRCLAMRRVAYLCAVLLAAFLITTWFQPHYVAPVAGLIVLLLVQGIRQLRLWRWQGRPAGRTLVHLLPAGYTAILLAALAISSSGDANAWHVRRAHLLDDLRHTEGQHVVLVRYGANHVPHDEWVFNEADIDAAKVVWARDMGPEQNVTLLAYFKNRRQWVLDADDQPARLTALSTPPTALAELPAGP
jgi:hypothetical protein